MIVTNISIFSGDPQFAEQNLNVLARTNGIEAAWRMALRDNPADALTAISGPFAIGLQVEDGSALLAVDRFAVETICYRIDDAKIRFAGRADELADESEIDAQAIFDYLYFHCIPSPRTIYKNVFRLPPGHFATFKQGLLNIQPYWTPKFTPQIDANFDVLKSEFLDLLESAVQTELKGSKPACFLSGGTDSSTVAGMIRKASGMRPATYSIGFEAEGYDEMEYARLASKHFQTDHHEYYVTPGDLVKAIPQVAAHYDQPFGNSSALPAYYCARMAQQDGVSRILAGDGGDELFGGNTRYAKQRIFSWWQFIPAALRQGALDPMFSSRWAQGTPLFSKGHSYVSQASVAMPARLQMYNLLLRLGIAEVLTPGFLALVDAEGPAKHQQSVWDSVGSASELNKTLAFDWRYTLGESDLPKVRETTKLAGIDVGFPMLNTALLDFSLQLPDAYKLKGLKLRWFFKEALRGFLPDEILVKKKQGFGLPFGVWLGKNPSLFELARDSLHTLSERGIVRPDFIKALMTQKLREHPAYYGEKVWILMMLENWLRAHAPAYKI
ncbi:asparagine synthase C-terminal domain-containing protein [Paucibacter sp. B2R-40]|uniref:asparagine synthetase B family protein n=1 Tax=Paucibacter sp. B2R-40 TaxID=2893554 RepID=UPI0021E37505|nr:asparagine synthase C-terminal domain-containing protein [Paucibacter sp. B2R-40]MCV2355496.1 asparagine synthase C-terminal domain-containing protein [Paucibacter sp. B2R-40]